MEYRPLGRTGVTVSAYCLGAMMFGDWGNTDEDECIRMVHAALDGDINFVDTADVYSRGRSEETVGKALKGRRDQVVLATKVHGPMGDGLNEQGNSRLWIERERVESDRGRLAHREVPEGRGHPGRLPGGTIRGAVQGLARGQAVRHVEAR